MSMKSYGYFFGLFVSCLSIVGCVSAPSIEKNNWTIQPIERAVELRPGLAESEVSAIMGTPITREFSGRGAALQWCATGMSGSSTPFDRFVIGFFYDGKLVGTRNYHNAGRNVHGDCSTLYRSIEWRPSDKVIEYRQR